MTLFVRMFHQRSNFSLLGSFLNIVIKLSSFNDSDFENLQKIDCFNKFLRLLPPQGNII